MGEGGETQGTQSGLCPVRGNVVSRNPQILKSSKPSVQTLTQPRQVEKGMTSSILAWKTSGASPHMA